MSALNCDLPGPVRTHGAPIEWLRTTDLRATVKGAGEDVFRCAIDLLGMFYPRLWGPDVTQHHLHLPIWYRHTHHHHLHRHRLPRCRPPRLGNHMVLNLGELTSARGCTNNVRTIVSFVSQIVFSPCPWYHGWFQGILLLGFLSISRGWNIAHYMMIYCKG